MSYPAGVQTSKLTFSNPKTHGGKDADRTEITVQPTASIVWAETGEPLDDFAETVAPSPGMPGVFTAPCVDQPGVRDQAGNAFTMWAYIVTRRSWLGGVEGRPVRKTWQPLLGQADVDFDTLPGGSIGLPVSVPIPPVTSVNGKTNAVTVIEATPENVADALPPRLSEATLKSTILDTGKAVFGQLAAAEKPADITLNAAFDPATRAYNINRSTMVKARAGIARGMSGAAPMRLHFLGHSFLTSNQGSTTHHDKVIPGIAQRIMAADGAFGTVAEGQVMMNYSPANGWGGVQADARFTFGTGWVYAGSWGLGYGAETCYSADAGSGDLTWTPDYPVDSFTIYYYQQAGSGQFSYAVDAGAFATTGVTFGTGGTFVLKSVTVAAGAAGTHTLRIRPPATGGITYVGAVYGTNSTVKPAVEVVNGGASGSVAYGATVGSWTYPGYQSVGGPLDAIGFFKPDLACIMLGVNDAASVSVANFKTAMTTIIQKVQTSGGDVIILREPATASSFNLYGPTLYELCDTLGAGLIETGIDWPSAIATSKAEPFAYIGADNGHPGPRGNYDIAKTVVNALRTAI